MAAPVNRLIEVEREGAIRLLSLSAPERRNAISAEMRAELLAALADAVHDPSVRAIILTGKGGHFCAGGDLAAANGAAADPGRTEANVKMLQDIVRAIAGPKPVLAAIEGSAFGAGMSLAAACDFAIAARSSRFAASFAKIGLCADAGLTWSLPQRIGLARSRRLMISGEVVSASQALEIGLVDELTDDGEALAVALTSARRVSELAPLSISAVKAILGAYPYSLSDALETELHNQVRLVSTSDYVEGRTAFLEKRAAVFTGA